MNRREDAKKVLTEVGRVILGKDDCIDKIMMAILAEGHVLVEDIPGVGKTTLALAFARVMGLQQKRVQFTPDVLPSDITGFSIFHRETGRFDYQAGAVLCNLFLADEINRTSAKTQSALLEVMEEGAVTVDGESHPVPKPFAVIATENPVGSAGTQMLPESQLDRFMICVKMGYPSPEEELEILMERPRRVLLNELTPVIDKNALIEMQEAVRQVYIHPTILNYIVSLAVESRKHPKIELGLSPRGSLAVASMVRAFAYLQDRDYAIPDDVQAVFGDVSRHRLRLSSAARMEHQKPDDIIAELLNRVPKPRPEKSAR